jgi:hypothetical protein
MQMRIPRGETKPGSSAVLAEVSLGLKSYDKVEVRHNVAEVTVYTETPDFTTESPIGITATIGSGILIYKDTEGMMRGRRILEPGTTACLATGVRYCYWATTGVFKALEHANHEQVTPENSEQVIDLQQ